MSISEQKQKTSGAEYGFKQNASRQQKPKKNHLFSFKVIRNKEPIL